MPLQQLYPNLFLKDAEVLADIIDFWKSYVKKLHCWYVQYVSIYSLIWYSAMQKKLRIFVNFERCV